MKKTLGFRADPSNARYAIVAPNGSALVLENSTGESRLLYPANINDVNGKIIWLYREMERIFHADPAIERVVVKTNEYGLRETAAMRASSYIEAAVLLFCGQRQMPAFLKTYASLSTRSADVKIHAEQRIGRTAKYWDTKIADAIIAGWWGATT